MSTENSSEKNPITSAVHTETSETPKSARRATRPSLTRRSGAVATSAMLIAGGGALGIGGSIIKSKEAEIAQLRQDIRATRVEDHKKYRALLKYELVHAYDGNPTAESAEVTDKTVTMQGDPQPRGKVRVMVGGGHPDRVIAGFGAAPVYTESLNETVTLPGGGQVPGTNLRWEDKKDKVIDIFPSMYNFAGHEPATVTYKLELVDGGYLPNERELDAVRPLGEVVMTGHDGKITSATVEPRPADVPPVQLVEQPAGVSILHMPPSPPPR